MKKLTKLTKTLLMLITAFVLCLVFTACNGGACEHKWSNGKCAECDAVCKHIEYTDSKCNQCGMTCEHKEYTGTVCAECLSVCAHASYTNGVCNSCGFECRHSAFTNGACNSCGYVCEHRYISGRCFRCSLTMEDIQSSKPEFDVPVIVLGETDFEFVYSDDMGSYLISNKTSGTTGFTDVLTNIFFVFFDEFYLDTEFAESDYEILFGKTNRQLSQELAAVIDGSYPSDSYVWGIACNGTQIAFYANNYTALEYMYEDLEEKYITGDLVVKSNMCYIGEVTKAEHDALVDAVYQDYKAERLEKLIPMNEAFTLEQFGGGADKWDKAYNSPTNYPIDEHPRYMLTADMIPDIIAFLENPLYKDLSKMFWGLANIRNGEKIPGSESIYNEGIMKDVGSYSYDGRSLAVIEAKALAYLITGDELYGYEAIVGMKNAILTLDYPAEVFWDEYRGADKVLTVLCAVYDWCYDMLTEDDMEQFASSVTEILGPQLETSCPPVAGSPITGHGTGTQFMRTWVSIGIAFYNEQPMWWELIGGRFYQQFVPAMNKTLSGGYCSQGALYGPGKYIVQCQAAWLVKVATGVMPFHENMANTHKYMLAERMPNGNLFVSGDAGASSAGYPISSAQYLYFCAALFPNSGLTTLSNSFNNNGISYDWSWMNITPAIIVPLMSQAAEPSDDAEGAIDLLNLITYTPYPAGQLNSRSDWTGNAVSVWAKIGGLTQGNHDHSDAGTFQIYYKGLITSDTGVYVNYGSNHWTYWHSATVSHNGVLVFDPERCEAPVWENGYLMNPGKALYTGGQGVVADVGDYSNWVSGKYDYGKETGHAYGYDVFGNPEYAYIAGDITEGYAEIDVDFVGRKMLTVYTGDPDFPMYFFVFDSVDSDKETSIKKFLLHTYSSPVINEQNKSLEVKGAGEGMLVLHNMAGENVQFEVIGGKGHAYEINGVQVIENKYTPAGQGSSSSGYRTEISTTGSKSSNMLNAMYVTDTSVTDRLTVTRIGEETDGYAGVTIGDVTAVFLKGIDPYMDSVTFTSQGEGNMDYYISNLDVGTWIVKVDGVEVGSVYSSDEAHMVKFTAPAGEVTLSPGPDMLQPGYGKLILRNAYNVSDEISLIYKMGEVTSLDYIVPTNGRDVFKGWYTDSTYTEKVEEIPADAGRSLVLYARWEYVFHYFDGTAKPGWTNVGMGITAAYDEVNDEHYLTWRCGPESVIVGSAQGEKNPATMASNLLSIEVELSYKSSYKGIITHFRIDGAEFCLFQTQSNGTMLYGPSSNFWIGGQNNVNWTVSSERKTFRFLIDFGTKTLYAVNEDGSIALQKTLSTLNKASFANAGFNWRTQSNGSYSTEEGKANNGINVYKLIIREGNHVGANIP